MRNSGKKISPSAMLFGATGWLFADLLLALAMIFLVASPSGELVAPINTPVPVCTATPIPVPALNPKDVPPFVVTIDPAGIGRNDHTAVTNAKNQVRQYLTNYLIDHQLTGSRAGLVILFGGAPTVSDYNHAVANDEAFFNNVLLGLGKASDHFLFTGNVAKKSLAVFSQPFTYMKVDIFLFTAPVQAKVTGGCALPTLPPTQQASPAAADINRFD
jgi:hypothetical protein